MFLLCNLISSFPLPSFRIPKLRWAKYTYDNSVFRVICAFFRISIFFREMYHFSGNALAFSNLPRKTQLQLGCNRGAIPLIYRCNSEGVPSVSEISEHIAALDCAFLSHRTRCSFRSHGCSLYPGRQPCFAGAICVPLHKFTLVASFLSRCQR